MSEQDEKRELMLRLREQMLPVLEERAEGFVERMEALGFWFHD